MLKSKLNDKIHISLLNATESTCHKSMSVDHFPTVELMEPLLDIYYILPKILLVLNHATIHYTMHWQSKNASWKELGICGSKVSDKHCSGEPGRVIPKTSENWYSQLPAWRSA